MSHALNSVRQGECRNKPLGMMSLWKSIGMFYEKMESCCWSIKVNVSFNIDVNS